MAFYTVIQNVALMLAYIACGLALTKAKKAVTDHAKSMSGLLVYVCGPCLVLSSFQKMDHEAGTLEQAGLAFGLSMVFMALFFAVMYALLNKKHSDPRIRLMTVAGVAGNTGFFGVPLVTGIFPAETNVACWCMMYTVSMNVVLFTAGIFMLTHDRKHMSVKSALLNPAGVMAYIALALYLLRIQIPSGIGSKIELMGQMATPLCMVSLGMRLASMDIKRIFTQPFAYVVCLLKLVIFPLFVLVFLKLIPGISETLRVTLYIASCAPCAVMVLSLAELHETARGLSANIVLLSTMLSIITLPLMTLLA